MNENYKVNNILKSIIFSLLFIVIFCNVLHNKADLLNYLHYF